MKEKEKKPKIKKDKHDLIKDVTIGDKVHKKGSPVWLTIEAAKLFKKLNRIK